MSWGLRALTFLQEHGVDISAITQSEERPTGTVEIELDAEGVAQFEFARGRCMGRADVVGDANATRGHDPMSFATGRLVSGVRFPRTLFSVF